MTPFDRGGFKTRGGQSAPSTPEPSSGNGIGARRKTTGTTGGVDGITSLAHLTALLAARFAPASSMSVPLASVQTGHRSVVGIVVSKTLTLTGGSATWAFDNPFAVMPTVCVTPFGAPPAAGVTLYISVLSVTTVTVTSTSNADVRVVNIIASGNPN